MSALSAKAISVRMQLTRKRATLRLRAAWEIVYGGRCSSSQRVWPPAETRRWRRKKMSQTRGLDCWGPSSDPVASMLFAGAFVHRLPGCSVVSFSLGAVRKCRA